MFASKQWAETMIRAALIVAVISNAFIPTPAIAMPDLRGIEASSSSSLSVNPSDMKSETLKGLLNFLRSSISFGAVPIVTPTPSLTETQVVTDSPTGIITPPPSSATPSATVESTLVVLPTLTVSPTFDNTAVVSETPSPTPTALTVSPTVSTDSTTLAVTYTASPNQVKVGDHVTFTLTIANKGLLPVTGLSFTNTLPEGFSQTQSEDKNFHFDPVTRILTWKQDPLNPAHELPAGGSLSLAYAVVVESQKKDVEVIDSASVSADGLQQALSVQAHLIILGPETSRTIWDANGGTATSSDGRIQLSMPSQGLNAPAAVLIENLATDVSLPDEPWVQFKLELQALPPQTSILPDGLLENDQTVPLTPMEAQFSKPVSLTVSLNGLLDLSTLAADRIPFLVTLDETSGAWVRMPVREIDRKANLLTAELPHFSVWGIGIGSAVPQNGANVLLYDSPYSSLFTGRSHYSFPIWTPPGRNGMQPNLILSYSSGVADGILGDVQAPWLGMGWNIDTVEIARKITNGGCSPCGGGSYGYENKFVLLFNGVGDELIPDATTPSRYHTREESFLYVQRHNDSLGNNSPAATNATGEWWEVVKKDGTRWRLGWTADSEQLAAMYGYPGAATGTWATLGYAGHATNVVAFRWRADQVTDVFNNAMTFTYTEETRLVSGTSTNYDRASYADTIKYTAYNTGTSIDYSKQGYSVVFSLEDRLGSDVPASPTAWDNWDTKRLNLIQVKYGTTTVRTYDLGYQTISHTDGSPSATWQTTVLNSVASSGSTTVTPIVNTTAPTVTFTYVEKDNRAVKDANSNEWAYPRLATSNSGWGSTTSYTYENDARHYLKWYNWRIDTLDITDSVNANPMRTTFDYFTPCYRTTLAWCNPGDDGELVGYEQVNEITLDFSLNTFVKTFHYFLSQQEMPGREYQRQVQNSTGTALSQTNTTYTYLTTGLPTGCFFSFASQVDEYLYVVGTGLVQTSRTTYDYDVTTGNLTSAKEYDGSLALYRQTDYEYVKNTSASKWILNTLSRRTLKNASLSTVSKQEYGYEGNLPGVGTPTRNKPDLSRVVSGTQTIDTKYVYNTTYGNLEQTLLYKNYGSTSSQPSGTFLTYVTDYDTALETYVVSQDPPLIPATTTNYDFGLGLPITVTDPNTNPTTTTYDGLGRTLTVKYPGYTSANINYTYSTPPGNAPYGVKTETLDEDAGSNIYRTSWKFMDGLGRTIQTQSEYEVSGYFVATDTAYNIFGQVKYSGIPRQVSGTMGSYATQNWNSIAHNTTSPDALGRVVAVTYPDSTTSIYAYSGLRTTTTDRSTHQKIEENDAFGRLIKVEEYTGSNPYTLYATTNYTYDERDLLKSVTDFDGNQTTIIYDNYGRKIEMTDPDLGNWRYRYDVFGNVTAQIDARRRALNMYYDDLNRLKGTNVTGSVNPDTYQPPADPGYAGYSDKYYYDAAIPNGWGHRTSMSNSNITTSWTYNVLGQVTSETQNIDGTPYTISTTSDAFGRPLSQTIPSQGSTETLTYDYTVMQLLSSVKGTGNYSYVSQVHHDATGQVNDELFGNGLVKQSCYDNNRRKTVLRYYLNPLVSSCIVLPSNLRLNLAYTYQSNGNLTQVLDSTRNATLNYTYDDLDRLTSVNGSYNRTFTYYQIGNINTKNAVNTFTNPGTTHLAAWWTMDEMSSTRKDSHTNQYDLTDNNTVGWELGPQGKAANFVAANQERLTVADKPNLSGGDVDFTLIANVYLNNNTSTFVILDKSDNVNVYDYRLAYNSGTGFRFRVSSSAYVDSGAVSANAWHTVIAWHDAGNNNINIQVDNGTVNTVAFSGGTTDSNNSLSIGALPGGGTGLDGRIDEVAIYRQRILNSNERAWIYNNGIRRTYADLTASDAGSAVSYTYGNAAHKHAVTSLTTGEIYDYDANGNMITRTEFGQSYTQIFDTQNRLTAITAGGLTTQFQYDPDGNLVKKINPDGSRTIYVGGVYEVDKNSGGTVTGTKTYYPVAGAMRVGSTLYYVLKDKLGSSSVVTDSTGVTLGTGGEQRYYPYGEKVLPSGITVTDKLFTGQRDTGLGIYYYGARFYSPYINRFLSADTVVPGYAEPQGLNRYSYVLNNPLRYTDPSGHRACDNVDAAGRCITAPGGGGMGFGGTPHKPPKDNGSPNDLITVVPDGPSCWDYATACMDLDGNYSPSLPGWHYYYNFNLVCPAYLHCTPAQMRDYLSRFVFPGQDPNNIVRNDDYNWVQLLGQIQTSVSVDGLTIINVTQPLHLMRNGQVIRMAVPAPDGAWYVATIGTGNNVSIPITTGVFPSSPINPSWASLAPLNQKFGAQVFNNFDTEMANYIAAHQ